MDDVEKVRERIDIVQLINDYAPLKKAGRNFKTNCPFHTENTPSFMVSPERQMWHCFGCGKGGDIYTFLMEYEHMEFPEALRFLAKKAGIELSESPRTSQQTSRREKLYQLNQFASSFYHYILLSHNAGKKALSYLTERGVNKGALETFRIGFAPSSGNALVTYLLKKKGCREEDIVDAGLGIYRGRNLQDFFSSRIMFPLIDHRDNVIGFSGRVLSSEQNGPKYINTKETPVYHKGDHFFGINIAKDAMRKEGSVLVVEGEFDVISCFQEGIANTVAIKGTALTQAQVRLLARYVSKVSICFDQDKAGQDALTRSISLLEQQDLTTTVVKLATGKDPAEAIQKDPYRFKEAVKKDIPVYDYLLERQIALTDPKSAAGKKQIADILLPLFGHIQNQIIKEHYLKKLSVQLDTSYESLSREMQRHEKPSPLEKQKEVTKDKRPREENIEEYLLALILQFDKPQSLFPLVFEKLQDSMPKERACQKILFLLHDYFLQRDLFDSASFGEFLPTELLAAYNTCMLYPVSQFFGVDAYKKEVVRISDELLVLYLRERLKMLAIHMKEREKKGEQIDDLQQEYSSVISRIKN